MDAGAPEGAAVGEGGSQLITEALQLSSGCRCSSAARSIALPALVTLTCVPVAGAFSDTVNISLSVFLLQMKENSNLRPHIRVTVFS